MQAIEDRIALDEQQPGIALVKGSKQGREGRIVLAQCCEHLGPLRVLRRHVRQELAGFAGTPRMRKDARPCHRESRRGKPRERVHLVQQLNRVIVAS